MHDLIVELFKLTKLLIMLLKQQESAQALVAYSESFTLNGKQKIKHFYKTENKICWVGRLLHIPDIPGLVFQFRIYPNGDSPETMGKVGFKLYVELTESVINSVSLNFTVYHAASKNFMGCYYSNTFHVIKTGEYGINMLCKLKRCIKLQNIHFVGSLDVLKIVNTHWTRLHWQEQIKIPQTIQCVWKISATKNRSNNIEIYSPHYGHSDNWLFMIKFKTDSMFLTLTRLPSDIHAIQIMISSNSLIPQSSQKLWMTTNSLNNNIKELKEIKNLKSRKVTEFKFKIQVIEAYKWKWSRIDKKEWGHYGII